jgi:hypothetical protein
MSLLADLINQEKNRRIVTRIFSSNTSDPLSPSVSNVLSLSPKQLDEQLLVLDKLLFDGEALDSDSVDDLIVELKAIASSL